MKKIQIDGLPLWQFETFMEESSIKHFITGRDAARGAHEFTLSFSSLPDKDQVRNNRNQLAKLLGIEGSRLYFPSQVHKTRIVNVTRNTAREELMETDALITRENGICIAVMSADCVPILLYDPVNKAVGAVHSGWRGTVAKILGKTILEMQSAFGTKPENLFAGIGPSVCQDSYEVGQEVMSEVNRAFGERNDLMLPQPGGKAMLDLWKANKIQLLGSGVRETRIEVSQLCTVKNNDHFFSARKGDSGRFAAGIMLI